MPLRATSAISAGMIAVALSPAFTGTGTASPAVEPQNFPAAHIVSNIDTDGLRCLDVDFNTRSNPKTNVQLFNCRPFVGDPYSGYQIFDRVSIPGRPSTEFKIRNQATGKCLTYPVGGNTGSPVWAESCNRNGQGWRRIDHSAKVTQFVALQANNRCLDAVDPSGGVQSGIDLYNCNSPVPQPYNTWWVD